MNKRELAILMLNWGKRKRHLDYLGDIIKYAILELGETQVAGNVEAKYNGGRKSYAYKAVGRDANSGLVEQYSKTITKTNWRKLVLDGMKVKQDDILCTQAEPSVSLELVEDGQSGEGEG